MSREHKWLMVRTAVCSCGWRSEREHEGADCDRKAMLDFVAHSRSCAAVAPSSVEDGK